MAFAIARHQEVVISIAVKVIDMASLHMKPKHNTQQYNYGIAFHPHMHKHHIFCGSRQYTLYEKLQGPRAAAAYARTFLISQMQKIDIFFVIIEANCQKVQTQV